MEEISKLFKCPCCYETPKPGPNNEIGLCANGHVCCYRCSRDLMEQKTECPVCRSPNIVQTTSHYTVNGLLSIFSSITNYSCKHEGCPAVFQGNIIDKHEIHCEFSPVRCPNRCGEPHIFQRLTSGKHPCVKMVLPDKSTNSIWNTTINIEDIFSVSSYSICVSKSFKPRMFSNPLSPPPTDRLFLNVEPFAFHGVMLFVGCIAHSTDSSPLMNNITSHIEAFVFTKEGSVGYSGIGRILYDNEKIKQSTDGIYLTNQTLINWIKWGYNYTCKVCPDNPKMHIHVAVSLAQTVNALKN